MKEIWLRGSRQVYGMMKGPTRHRETWWWNRYVEEVVAKYKHTLHVAKKEVYTDVMAAQASKLQEVTADLQSESARKNCCRITRQMAREGGHVINVCCIKNDVGNVVFDADGMKNIWRKYMERFLNIENDRDGEVDFPEAMWPCCLISEEYVAAANKKLEKQLVLLVW